MEITEADVAVLKELHKELPEWLVRRINTAISVGINTSVVMVKDVVDVVIRLDEGEMERYGTAVIAAMAKAGYSYVSDKSSSIILVFCF